MNEKPAPRLSKVPFLLGDLLLLGVAGWLTLQGETLEIWKVAMIVASVALAAWLGVWPFILQFRADMALADSSKLASATAQLGNLETLARQITTAGAEWQSIHQSTTQTVTAADQIAEKMIAEARNFGEVLSKLNETEKNHLRLEVDKLRRTEAEWLQLIVRIFDHIHALHQAAVRSGQRNVAEQLTHFQNACRDAARRMGFMSIVPPTGVPFDEKQHQLLPGETSAADALVAEIVAPGYTFQGQLLRLPVVAMGKAESQPAPKMPEPQTQLALGAEGELVGRDPGESHVS